MTRRIYSLLIVVLLAGSQLLAADYIEGRVIVRFKDGVHKQTAKSIKGPVVNKVVLDKMAKTVLPSAAAIGDFQRNQSLGVVSLPAGMTVDQAISEYYQSGLVEYAEPDYLREISALPNDYVSNIKWDLKKIEAPNAWDILDNGGNPITAESVRVAVIDTGVDYLHPDFYESKVADLENGGTIDPGIADPKYNFIWQEAGYNDDGDLIYRILGYDTAGERVDEYGPDNDPMDSQVHGTHVAGIIGAYGNNDTGTVGVNWRVSILPVKVFADDSETAALSDIISGIEWAITNDADIINMSLAGRQYSNSERNALNLARSNGIVVVAAADNQGVDIDYSPRYPASYDLDNIISVMATDQDDNIPGYSNYGLTSVDIAAPGDNIYSTLPNGVYGRRGGTSMAAPQVAGAIAMIKSFVDSGFSIADPACLWPAGQVPYNVIDLLYYSSDKIPSLAGQCSSEGRLNLYSIMKMLSTPGVILNAGTVPASPFTQTHGTINDAVAAANPGDTIWLYDNHWYFENVNITSLDLNFKVVDADPNQSDVAYITVNDCYPNNDTTVPTVSIGSSVVNFEGDIYLERSLTSAFYLNNAAELTLQGVTLRDNRATDGAAIYAELNSKVNLGECSLYDNWADAYGGAIYVDESELVVNDPNQTVFSNNYAGLDGGAIYGRGVGNIEINNSLFEYNSSASSGGAIAVDETKLIVAGDSRFIGNSAFYDGGAVYGDNAHLEFTETVFETNNTTGATFPPYGGGAIYCGNTGGISGQLIVNKVNFERNDAASDGGAIIVDEAVSIIDEAIFVGNKCLGDGGAVFVRDSQSATITNSVVASNISELFGGGISVHSSIVELSNLLMYDNSSYWWAGAVYIYGKSETPSVPSTKSEVKITNCTIGNNSCFVFGGGVYVSDNGQPATDNNKLEVINTIFNNNSRYSVYEEGLDSTVISTNSLYYNIRDIEPLVYYKGSPLIRQQTIQGSLGGSNLVTNPMFVPGFNGFLYDGLEYSGDYYLSHTDAGQVLDADGNIAADAGTSATSPAYGIGVDVSAYIDLSAKSPRTDGVAGVNNIGYHYSHIITPLVADQNVIINVSPAKGGTVSPISTDLFKPYGQVILEATSNIGYVFKHWTDSQGNKLTEITESNPDGDYFAIYDANGDIDSNFYDNTVDGVPFKIIITLDSSKIFYAVFEEETATLRTRVVTQNGSIFQGINMDSLVQTPIVRDYVRGQVVYLKVVPIEQQHKVRWHGTDNDASLARTNTVKLKENFNDVWVEIFQPNTWTVGPQSDTNFDSLRQALTHPDVNAGDVITVMPGIHEFDENNNPDDPTPALYIDKDVVIQGGSTGNPEATIIKNGIIIFRSNISESTIIRDITFDYEGQVYHSDTWGWDGCTTLNPFPDGDHGPSGGGAIMEMLSQYDPLKDEISGASPTIENCRFVNGTFRVANGKNGCVQEPIHGDGGWPGISYGGGINIGNFANPVFDRCEFINLRVIGGHGGNAPDRAVPGLWGDPTDLRWPYVGHTEMLPGFVDIDEIEESSAFRFVLPHEIKEEFPAQEEKNQYAGRGGAMYIGIGAEPIIRNSRFEGCSAMSGSSGISGANGAPSQHYRIPSYGGAVFCDAMSKPEFDNVEFVNNIAHWEQPTNHPDGGSIASTNDYQSNGGAVYAQRNALPKFVSCYFEGNQAVVGGAIAVDNIGYIDDNDIEKFMIIEDCRFVDNRSDIGGALVVSGGANSRIPFLSSITYPTMFSDKPIEFEFTNYPDKYRNQPVSTSAGFSMLIRSDFSANQAIIQLDGAFQQFDEDGEPVDLISQDAFAKSGHGGAIASYSAFTEINDCRFQENLSGGFGGAIYVSGKNIHTGNYYHNDYSNMYLRNCLLVHNYAGLGGGAISATTYSDPRLNNCTIADNAVTAAAGKGGGILVSDVSTVSVQNSILYGNICSNGSQIALVEAHEGEPSNADVQYSLVEEFVAEPEFIDTGLKAIRTMNGDDEHTINVDMVNDYRTLPAQANAVSDFVDIGFAINYYGRTANRIFVSDNGLVSFFSPISGFSEFVLNSNIDVPVIAPFHADVDTSSSDTVSYGRGTIVVDESGIYVERRVFFVNYIDVGYYNQGTNKLNSFQLVLIEKGDNNFDIEFNYGNISWESGDNQGGTDGIGGTTPRVGFSKGTGIPGTFYELEGTGVQGAFLDNSTAALIARNRNSNATGRLVFPVRDGEPQIRFGSPVYVEGSSTINYDTDANQWLDSSVKTEDPLWAIEGLYYLSEPDTGDPEQIALGRSPAVDAGSGLAIDNHIYRHSTRTDNALDVNQVDIGYHYVLPTTAGLIGDFNFDGMVTLSGIDNDLSKLSSYWISEFCNYPYWCHGTDLNRDQIVNNVDFVMMESLPNATDVLAPQPILGEDGLLRDVDFSTDEPMRMTWEQKPVSAGSGVGAITMKASNAIDNVIGAVEYGFRRTLPLNSPLAGADAEGIYWQPDPIFTDTGLVVDQEYAYQCFARDVYGNKTLASLAAKTTAGDDSNAPTVDGIAGSSTKPTWAVPPETATVVGDVASIRMIAEIMIDPEHNGVQYFFECTSGGGHNSTWQDSPEYVDTGLEVGVLYTYRVKTRDISRNFNQGEWSDEASALASAATIVDREKPAPLPYIYGLDVQYRQGQSQQDMWQLISATASSTDASGPVWYQFICTTNNKFSSPRIYAGGGLEEGYELDTRAYGYSAGEGSITWEVNVGFPSRTESWKIICGDSAEPVENSYTPSDQPQTATVGAWGFDLDLDNVEFYNPPAEEDTGDDDGGDNLG